MTVLSDLWARGTGHGACGRAGSRLPDAPCPIPAFVRRGVLSIVALLSFASSAGAQRRVILFIGDGVGVSQWTAARIASPDALAVSRFKVMGLVDTRASNALITDSGAGATAYATGVRSYYFSIGVGPDSQPVETVLEAAKKKGWATGIVATSSVTHATPAAFVSHVKTRASEFDIAKQMVALGPDVMFGAGTRFFSPRTRPDTADLISALRTTHTLVTDPIEFERLRDTTLRRVAGLFGEVEMPPAARRTPTLPAMTRKAIDVLSRDPDGFFLMVEGSQTDWRAHDNLPMPWIVNEILDFDAAIGVALEYQRRVPDVLILVVADHETGGLAIETATDSAVMVAAADSMERGIRGLAPALPVLSPQAADSADSAIVRMQITAARLRANARGARTERLFADYTTGGHTAQMVPLFASGPGAEAFAGMIDNFRVGQLLLEIVRKPQPPPRRRREGLGTGPWGMGKLN